MWLNLLKYSTHVSTRRPLSHFHLDLGPSHPVTNRATCLVSGVRERHCTGYGGSCLVRCTMKATLNSPISLGHSNSLQPTLNFNLLQGSSLKLVWGTLVVLWVTIFIYATFVLQLKLKVLVGSLQEDLGEDSGSWGHITNFLTNFPPTLIGLCSVLFL